MESANTASRSAAVRDGLGVGIAVGLSGVAFGAAATTAGLTVAQACVLSLLAFTGASQFALVGTVAAGGSPMAGLLGALMLGGRNTLYGLRLSSLLNPHGPRRLPAAMGVIDETTAVAIAQPTPATARVGFATTAVSLYIMWNVTTLAGALGAGQLGDPRTFGLDAVGPATFLALVWPHLKSGAARRRVAAAGALIALAATPFLPSGFPVLIAALAVVAGWRR